MPVSITPYDGSVSPSALNSETEVVNISDTDFYIQGYIDLSVLQSGDEVVIKEYIVIESGGSPILYGKRTFSGVQEEPLVRFHNKMAPYGYKVTITQTAGTLRTFKYSFRKVKVT